MHWINIVVYHVYVFFFFIVVVYLTQVHSKKFYLVMTRQNSDLLSQNEILQTDPTLLAIIQEPRSWSHSDTRQTPQHIFRKRIFNYRDDARELRGEILGRKYIPYISLYH